MGLIISNINIREIKTDKWILASPHSSIVVNNKLYNLFKILNNSDSIKLAHESFNNYFNQNLSIEHFNKLIDKHFSGRGFLIYDDNLKQKKSYLSLRIDMISKEYGEIISSLFSFFFNKKIATIFSLAIIIGISFITYYFHSEHYDYKVSDLLLVFLILNSSLLFHEIGHITAYNYFIRKKKLNSHNTTGQIGFGFYFIFPVYFSNITQTWSLDKKSRIIINIAGIYFQLLFSIILLLVSLTLNFYWLIMPAYSIIIHAIFSLNPFIRSDGYWVLSDLTNSFNLLEKSKISLDKYLKTHKMHDLNWKVIYALGNYILIIALTLNIIIVAKYELLYFPLNLLTVFYNTLTLNFDNISVNASWIYYLGFYIMIFSFISNILKKYITVDKGRNYYYILYKKIFHNLK